MGPHAHARPVYAEAFPLSDARGRNQYLSDRAIPWCFRAARMFRGGEGMLDRIAHRLSSTQRKSADATL